MCSRKLLVLAAAMLSLGTKDLTGQASHLSPYAPDRAAGDQANTESEIGERPVLRFRAQTPQEAKEWQQRAREKLLTLMMGGQVPERVALSPQRLRRIEVPEDDTVLEELTLQTLADRRAHVWLARPAHSKGKVGAVLAINGHGGSGEQVVHGTGLYWYGRALSQMGYVVISPDVGQHELQHTNWSLMGERTWDALRSIDYVLTLPEVDPARVAVAGLSLGGETTMYVAALDERVKAACSSGWLTTFANMTNGHCPCFNFSGLEENFDFSDIFSCAAPRALVCELGEQERAPGGFPVRIGRQALEGIRAAYRVFNAESNLTLTVHPGPHVFCGRDFWPRLRDELGQPRRVVPADSAAAAWVRFADAPEALDGTPYHWLGRTGLLLAFDVPPQAGDELELSWGAKADVREAVIAVNGKKLDLQTGGHWGFRWVRVPIPLGVKGDRYQIEIQRGQGQPAFLSEVRLARSSAVSTSPDLNKPAANAKLTLSADAQSGEGFPEMRAAWDRPRPLPADVLTDKRTVGYFRAAEENARLANEAFFRCTRYVDGWLAHTDPATGLIPRNLGESRDYWNGRDSAADNYPFMVLTAAMTDRPLLRGRLLDMLRTETRLTCRVDRLPDDYSFSKKGWRREKLDLDAIIFDGAEYVKDGLLYVAGWLGPSPWSERMIGITDDIWKNAKIETPYGKIPTLNFEVCGDLLQAGSRLYWFTGDRKYLDWSMRLGDYFLLGTNHPTRDVTQLRLIDHGCEVVNGLTELYVAVSQVAPEKKQAYEKPMHEMFDCILGKGRNEDGLLYTWFNPKTGAHSKDLCDTWGYDYDGFYTMWLVDKTATYREAVRHALSNLKGKYVGACWADKSADGFADSIEGAINLLNRERVESAADWVDSQTRMMWAIQKPDGIIEAWHGDGNFARTSLMYGLWKTQGVTVEPWRPDVRFGTVRNGDTLFLTVSAEKAWNGRLIFDRPRHKDFMHLPLDYTRINQFPEWFTVAPGTRYEVLSSGGKTTRLSASKLLRGIPIRLKAGEAVFLELRPR
ncbi:MAG TPA: acetylxylan esterase [Verrucomicrobiae bacterium]